MIAEALGVMAGLNALSFLLFWIDKRAARAGGRRVPERTLLLVALAGGSIGAAAAQRILRHKTRKQPFAGRLGAILGLHLVLATALGWAVATGHGSFVGESAP